MKQCVAWFNDGKAARRNVARKDASTCGEDVEYSEIAPKSARYRELVWAAASAIQGADGLAVSEYANAAARRYVEGEVSAYGLARDVEGKYATMPSTRQAEADVVAARITEMLDAAAEIRFELAPKTLLYIHATLFRGQLEHAEWEGCWRERPTTKAEPVLGGRSVAYSAPVMILPTLEYDFAEERGYRYPGAWGEDDVNHFADFISGIWQVHPFREGNTRTCATFSQIYLTKLGVPPDNEVYGTNGQWYRDALVRAAYVSPKDGIPQEKGFIRAFYKDVICGTDSALTAMDMNIHGIRTLPDAHASI